VGERTGSPAFAGQCAGFLSVPRAPSLAPPQQTTSDAGVSTHEFQVPTASRCTATPGTNVGSSTGTLFVLPVPSAADRCTRCPARRGGCPPDGRLPDRRR
jgi:hypothetical protein